MSRTKLGLGQTERWVRPFRGLGGNFLRKGTLYGMLFEISEDITGARCRLTLEDNKKDSLQFYFDTSFRKRDLRTLKNRLIRLPN